MGSQLTWPPVWLLVPQALCFPAVTEHSLSPDTWLFSCLPWETARRPLRARAVSQSLGLSPKPGTKKALEHMG